MKVRDFKEIYDLCCELEEKTDYCVFFHNSGHVEMLDCDIAYSKKEYSENIIEGIHCKKDELIELIKKLLDPDSDLTQLYNERYIKKYNSYIALGVPKTRAISNTAKDYGVPKTSIKTIIDSKIK